MALRVLVLFGGVSTEYLVSLRSAVTIIGGLRDAGCSVMCVGITQDGEWLAYDGPDEAIRDDAWIPLARSNEPERTRTAIRSPRDFILSFCEEEPDVVFPAVHGINCEDGALQGLLTLAGFPFVGCGVLASAVCMDKISAKKLLSAAGIPVTPFLTVTRAEIETAPEQTAERVITELGVPCFLKPSNGGSSVGTCRADRREDVLPALQNVAQYDAAVLVEQFVSAREIEVAVLGNHQPEAALPGEILTAPDVVYYDYETKYCRDDGSATAIPANLPADKLDEVRTLAIRAYRELGCAGLARVDFFLDRSTGRLMLNEINTLPGFTSISLYPKAWIQAGMTIAGLVLRLCELALEQKTATARRELF